MNTKPSYVNSIIASTAIVMTLAQQFYDTFDIQEPVQLGAYFLVGTIIGTTISKRFKNKPSKLENCAISISLANKSKVNGEMHY